MELFYVTVDFMTTPYVLNIKLHVSDKFNTKIFAKICIFISDMVTQANLSF